MLGMVVGMGLTRLAAGSQLTAWAAFLALTWLHIVRRARSSGCRWSRVQLCTHVAARYLRQPQNPACLQLHSPRGPAADRQPAHSQAPLRCVLL